MTPVRQRAADKLPAYVLRDIPEPMWEKVKARAEKEGRSLRGLILWLLTKYAKGEIR